MVENTGLTIALILVALAVLMQACAMIGIWLVMRKIPGQIEAVRTDVKQVYIQGVAVPMVSRQTKLRDQYSK